MAKNKKTNDKSIDDAVKASRKKANIIVCVVAGIALLFIIAVIVLCTVSVDPLDGVATPDEAKHERYDLYDRGGSEALPNSSATQSKIRSALGEMDFTVMNAILQWNWDYSYNFWLKDNGEKRSMTGDEVYAKVGSSDEYMIEYVYENCVVDGEIVTVKAKSLEVDGETVYFDRLKVVIGDTAGSVGWIYLYPYVYEYATNKIAEEGVRYEKYSVNPIRVRANTTDTYAALGELVTSIKNS